jgi:hypothetical protein
VSFLKTPINAWDVPDASENINRGALHVRTLGYEAEQFTVMRFANMATLLAKLVGDNAPKDGMVAFVDDVDQLLLYAGGAWHRVYPTERMIYSGTTTPAASLGTVGDLYYQF